MSSGRIGLHLREERGIARRQWPLTRGVPLPKGALKTLEDLWIEDADGLSIPGQFRLLSRWPDSSVKWVLADFQADLEAGGEAEYALCYEDAGQRSDIAVPPDRILELREGEDAIEVCTGAVRFEVSRRRFGLIERVVLGRRDGELFIAEEEVTPADAGAEAWVRIREGASRGGTERTIYGMGGDCLASIADDEYSAEVEEAGPLRVVIACRGRCEAFAPMHHYKGYRPFHITTRIYAYAGHSFLRVLHTVVMACNARETEVEEIGVRVAASLDPSTQYQVASRRPRAGTLSPGQSLLLAQRSDNHFHLYQRQDGQRKVLAEGERTEGWLVLNDERVGVGVGFRYMAEEYPKALGTAANGQGIDVYLWQDPQGERLSLRRYDEDVAWHEGEGVYADGTGTAKTSEFFTSFFRAGEQDEQVELLRGALSAPHVALEPGHLAACEVTGGFAPEGRFPRSDRMMTGFVDWLRRNIELGHWYGFFDWGDVLVAWEESENDWRFRGRWGWCNSEWDPRHGVWIQYLRTGARALFELGEAMTRHSTDVDTCHYHPFRPYMVGGCYRHSIDHFGDEPCASHTFIDNWVDYYYLSGDARTLEVVQEAGEFFLRYTWSEDPRFSFSLRSIANVLRGLLYAYELTGAERFMRRAEEVYEVIARGQNDDGSWHKRFQVSTADKLPDQGPYAMASEGTTLAVELGTADSFTDEEYRVAHQGYGTLSPRTFVVPVSDQKGYQTHYLMVGLELFHRMTGRRDVAEVYRRAVDWFCGNDFNADFSIGQHYYGIICRHLAYAWRLSGDERYLQIGRAVLARLMQLQDQSDDPRRRGAVGQSPMGVSLLFFGVPYLLAALAEAGMDEPEP